MQFYQVQLRAIAFVLAEAIFGKPGAKVAHNRVARHFCDHACGSDAQTVAIAVDDRRLRQGKRKNRQAVDKNVLGSKRERIQRRSHRFMGGSQDIDRVDLD